MRKGLSKAEWPEEIRHKWEKSITTDELDGLFNENIKIYSKPTITSLESILGMFLRVCRDNQLQVAATEKTLKLFLEFISGTKINTKSGYILGLTSALKLLEIDTSELADMRKHLNSARKRVEIEKTFISPDRLNILGMDLMAKAQSMTLCQHSSSLFRDGLLFYMLIRIPFRCKNFIGLRLSDIETNQITLLSSETKANEEVTAIISKSLRCYLDEYLDTHRPNILGNIESDYLFPSNRSKVMSISQFGRNISKHCTKYLGVHYSPHRFRDSAATGMIEGNPGNPDLASHLLGHRSMRSKETYTKKARALTAGKKLTQILSETKTNAGKEIRKRG